MGKSAVPQPDIALRILPEYGGQSRVEGNYAAGAPELIVEVAASSRDRDPGVKRKLYQRMGVQEYVVAVVNPAALLRLDVARVLAVLQEGAASPEHAGFVEQLARRKRQRTFLGALDKAVRLPAR